jgi:hypothetical protein
MDAGHDGPGDEERSARLSAGLKEAFTRLAAAPLDPDERARWQRRLIAVTNAAKRDLTRAEESLARFDHDWNAEVRDRR